MSTPKIVIMNMPPMFCTHLPIASPTKASVDSSAIASTDDSDTNHALVVIHAALGPIAYDRYVATVKPSSDANRITYSHRFQATRKPNVWLKPSFAHWYKPPSSGISWLSQMTTTVSGT